MSDEKPLENTLTIILSHCDGEEIASITRNPLTAADVLLWLSGAFQALGWPSVADELKEALK
jgi:hypothetical protein